MSIPTLQELQASGDFLIETDASGNVIAKKKPEQFTKYKERGETPQQGEYNPAVYRYSSAGQFLGGEEYGVRNVFYTSRVLQEAPYARTVYSVENGQVVSNSYELVPSKSGKIENVEFFQKRIEGELVKEKTNLTPTQKENIAKEQAQSEEAKKRLRENQARGLYGQQMQDVRAAAYRGASEPQKGVQPGKDFTTSAQFAQSLFAKQEALKKQEQAAQPAPAQPEQPKPPFTPGGTVSEYKPGFFERGTRAVEQAQQEGRTTKAILLGTGVTAAKAARGAVQGFISVFRPSTYVNLWNAVTNPKETREAFYQVGEEIRQDPTELGRVAGEFYGAGKGFKVLSERVLPAANRAFNRVAAEMDAEDFAMRNRGKVVTAEQTSKELATTSKEVSVEVKGRPVEGIKAVRATVSGRAGTVEEGVLTVKTGAPEVIDQKAKVDYYLVKGTVKKAARVKPRNSVGSSSRDVARPVSGLVEERPISFIVEREKLVELLQGGKTEFASSGGKVKLTKSTLEDGNLLIIQKSVSTRGTPRVMQTVEVGEARITPIQLTAEEASAAAKGFKKRPKSLRYDLNLEDKRQAALPGRFVARTKYTQGTQLDLYVFESAEVLQKNFGTSTNPVQSIYIEKAGRAVGISSFVAKVAEKAAPSKVVKPTREIEITDKQGRVQVLQVEVEQPKTQQKTEQVLVQESKQEQAIASKSKTAQKSSSRSKSLQEVYGRQASLGKELSGQKSGTIAVIIPGQASSSLQGTRSRSKSKQKVGIVSKLAQGAAQGLDIGQAVSVASAVSSAQSVAQSEAQGQGETFFNAGERLARNRARERQKNALGKPLSIELPERKSGTVFGVQVRRGGKFVTIGSAESAEAAVQLGANIVDMTAAASFRITGNQGRVAEAVQNQLPRWKFGESRREAGVFIERSKGRIDTGGEQSEITFKGIAASQRKRLFGR